MVVSGCLPPNAGIISAEGDVFLFDIPGSTTNLGQSQLDAPDFALVLEAKLADELELRVTVYPSSGQLRGSLRLEQRQAHVSVAGDTDSRAASKGRVGTFAVLE